ncbi:hypothetical protein [Cetobacterium sp.]|uniref:hypothetical protein n=1 Tax=Cetobacterium sp. TaxID=2071632 RepID=UPI003F3E5EC4
MFGKDSLKLISYDFVDIDNQFYTGKAFKCIFEDSLIERYKLYYQNMESFLNGVEGTTNDKKIMDLLEKKKKNMLSDEVLKKDLIKILDIKTGK